MGAITLQYHTAICILKIFTRNRAFLMLSVTITKIGLSYQFTVGWTNVDIICGSMWVCTVCCIFRWYHSFSRSMIIPCFAGAKTQQGNHYYYVTLDINLKKFTQYLIIAAHTQQQTQFIFLLKLIVLIQIKSCAELQIF